MSDPPIAMINAAMNHAIALASSAAANNNYPLGAVVFDEQGEIASAASALVEGHDPSAHPELVAIRKACAARDRRYLPGAYLVTTLEPCPMCTSAAIWARMAGIVYATNQADAEAIGARLKDSKFTFRQIRIRCRDVLVAGEPRLALLEDFERNRVLEIYDSFAAKLGSPR